MFPTRFHSDLDGFIKPLFDMTISEICADSKVVGENDGLPFIVAQGLKTPYQSGADGTSTYAKQVDARVGFHEVVQAQMLKANVSFLGFPTTSQVALAGGFDAGRIHCG